MEHSPYFKTSLPAVPSPTASHIAALAANNRLQIRCLASFEVTHSFPLPAGLDVKTASIAWSPPCSTFTSLESTSRSRTARGACGISNRVVVSDATSARVFDLRDSRWSAAIGNGSGGMGRNSAVAFGGCEDEVLIWSEFGSRVVVWCLKSGRTVDVRDPKVVGGQHIGGGGAGGGKGAAGWGYRPVGSQGEDGQGRRTGVLALLCRTSGMDYLMLLRPSEGYRVLKKVELQTVDAQGLRWSRDGRWIAVWEGASHGYKLCIYTADGHLYRTVTREPSDDLEDRGIEGLGIKSVEWVPENEFLAVGGWDRRVRILSTRTFAPIMFLDHTTQICVPSATVYAENVDASGSRTYAELPQPATPPKAPLEKNESGLMKTGISILTFNGDGSLCATRDDTTSSTVWIWDLRSLRPKTILIQHSPVKSLQWHPTDPARLMIHTAQDAPIVYLYTASPASSSLSTSISETTRSGLQNPAPAIIDLASEGQIKPASSTPAKWTCTWLDTTPDRKSALMLAHQQAYTVIYPDGKDQILRIDHGQDDADESDDSLYDILTGRTPIPPLHDARRGSAGSSASSEVDDIHVDGDVSMMHDATQEYGNSVARLDDTFREKRKMQTQPQRGRSVFEESGIDEMF